jgi:RNA polymerase sigma-70 factor (ECF subfamily)
MDSTSPTLLERLRSPQDQQAWRRFVELYTPLLLYWAGRAGLQPQDAADLVQDVLAQLVTALPDFRYDGQGTFRGWLRRVTLNKWADIRRRRVPTPIDADGEQLAQLAGPDSERFWQEEYQQHLVRRALEIMQDHFEPVTWRACLETTLHDRPAADVARELGISEASVYTAKSRVLRRLREELAGMLD